jgi:hypothetical protein
VSCPVLTDSVFQFFKEESKADFKKIVGDNWIEPPRRERKRKYGTLFGVLH